MDFERQAQQMSTSEVASLLASHQAIEQRHQQLRTEFDQLKRQLAWLQNQVFGRKSERRLIDPDSTQLSLGEGLGETPAETELPAQSIPAHTRHPHRPSQESESPAGWQFDKRVPVEIIQVEDPALADIPPEELELIGEKVTWRLAQQPSQYTLLKYVRTVYKRKKRDPSVDGAPDRDTVHCPPAPAGVLDRSHADVSFLAGLIIDKLQYHLPLYRQHQRLADAGIKVSRGWLSQLVHRTGSLLEPLYLAQFGSIRASAVLAMDETPIKAGRKSRGKMKTTYYWPIYGDQDEVVFPWCPSRASPNVPALLGDYTGTLITDGYAAYARYAAQREGVVHAQCWAHARRGFVNAETAEPERAAEALERIGRLYEQEKHIAQTELEAGEKLAWRAEHSQPLVELFFAWCEEQLQERALLPTNPFTKALAYVLERQAELSVFLADPAVPIDTNHIERTLRPIPMGRKNWLFAWTELGAKYVGILQSLLVTCRLQGIRPYDYLVDVLQRIDQHPASDVHLLTPRLWKEYFADNRLRAPLDLIRQ